MFLFLDESDSYERKVIGGLLVPLEEVSELEALLVKFRIENKLFGEIKWTNLDSKYAGHYYELVSNFLNTSSVSYHSCSYSRRNNRYKAAYILIKAVSWKIENAGIDEPLHVLFDNGGDWGRRKCRIVRDYLKQDRKFNSNLEFCDQGHSHIMGCLQVSDVVTGAVTAKINGKVRLKRKKKMIDTLTKLNNGEIGVPINRFPRLDEFRMHHFNAERL